MLGRRSGLRFRQVVGAFSALALCGFSLTDLGCVGVAIAAPDRLLSSQLALDNAEEDGSARVAWMEEALLVSEDINDFEYKAIALASIGSAYAAQNDFDKANELLGLALQILEQDAAQDRYTGRHSRSLNRIAVGYLAMGEQEKADDVLQNSLASMGEIRSRTQNYGDFLEAVDLYATFGEAALAEAGLARATEIADAIEDGFRHTYALEKIAIAYGQLNDETIADAGITQIYQRLEAINGSLSGRLRAVGRMSTRIAIAEARARSGNTEAVIALLDPVLQSDSLYSLGKVADVYGLMPDSVMAKSALDALALVASEMVAEGEMAAKDDGIALVSRVAIAYADIGETAAARRFLNAVFPNPLALYSDDFDELGEAVSVFSQLARTYARVGDVETQQALLARTFELYIPEALPLANQLEAWQAIMFELMAQNYVQISEDMAADALDVLLQVSENGWDYSFPVYLASLARAERERGDMLLLQQRLDDAIALLNLYEHGASMGTGLGRVLETLTRLAEIYGGVLDQSVKREGLRSLTQAADGLADSAAKQRLLSAIALAYTELLSVELL